MIDIGQNSAVYIDTNIFIYWLEDVVPRADAVQEVFARIAACGARIITSEVTLAECIYKPAKDGDMALVALYEQLFMESGDIDLVPIRSETLRNAARNGGAFGLKLIDALHYQTALEAGCDVFLTSDGRFRPGPSLRVERVL